MIILSQSDFWTTLNYFCLYYSVVLSKFSLLYTTYNFYKITLTDFIDSHSWSVPILISPKSLCTLLLFKWSTYTAYIDIAEEFQWQYFKIYHQLSLRAFSSCNNLCLTLFNSTMIHLVTSIRKFRGIVYDYFSLTLIIYLLSILSLVCSQNYIY